MEETYRGLNYKRL